VPEDIPASQNDAMQIYGKLPPCRSHPDPTRELYLVYLVFHGEHAKIHKAIYDNLAHKPDVALQNQTRVAT
jgi:hypothetical protein